MLVDGRWTQRGYDQARHGGRFVRDASAFRSWVTPDGSPGPGGEGGFAAEPGRYHLYVSWACPWAHRTLIARRLKGLDDAITVDVVHWYMGEHGWTFDTGDGATGDRLHGARCLHEVYTRAKADYTGRVTVPVLWDRERGTIVSNESSEILRMLDGAFGVEAPALYPEAHRAAIDAVNERVYESVNNGVYRAGFATSQGAYEEACEELFRTLDWLEERLSGRRWLVAPWPTEADWRLFTTLVRFDAVYHGHFKCNLRRIVDYPALSGYLRDLYQQPGIRDTVRFDHIKRHYYVSHASVNPTGIVPLGPVLDLDAPHGRDAIGTPPVRDPAGAPAVGVVADAPVRRDATDAPVRRDVTDAPVRRDVNDAPVRRDVTDAPVRRDVTDEPDRRDVTDAPDRRDATGASRRRDGR